MRRTLLALLSSLFLLPPLLADTPEPKASPNDPPVVGLSLPPGVQLTPDQIEALVRASGQFAPNTRFKMQYATEDGGSTAQQEASNGTGAGAWAKGHQLTAQVHSDAPAASTSPEGNKSKGGDNQSAVSAIGDEAPAPPYVRIALAVFGGITLLIAGGAAYLKQFTAAIFAGVVGLILIGAGLFPMPFVILGLVLAGLAAVAAGFYLYQSYQAHVHKELSRATVEAMTSPNLSPAAANQVMTAFHHAQDGTDIAAFNSIVAQDNLGVLGNKDAVRGLNNEIVPESTLNKTAS